MSETLDYFTCDCDDFEGIRPDDECKGSKNPTAFTIIFSKIYRSYKY